VLVVGDEATLKVHVHTDDPESAMEIFAGTGEVTNLDVADMRKQVAEREARMAGYRTGVVAVGSGDGIEGLFAEMGAQVVPGGDTMNPSTAELLAGIREVPTEDVLVLPNSSNVIMAAERACELSEKNAVVIPTRTQQECLLALVEFNPENEADINRKRLGEALAGITVGGVAPAGRDDNQGRFMRGDAVGFCDGEIVAWGGAGSTLASTIESMCEGAEVITVIRGAGAPIPLDELDAHTPGNVEIDFHEGGQPSWWWLLASQ
jgi:dihydroxyacetone kinase-like predicted kinase